MNFLDVEGDFIRGKVLPDFQWTSFAEPTEPALLKKPVNKCKIALVVTAGAYLSGTQQRFETRAPLGDDSYRIIPGDTPAEQISLSHPGYDTKRALTDLDTVFPIQLLMRMQENGTIGAVAPRHASFMGYIPRTERLLWNNAPQVARMLRDDGVDLVILVPS
ncbi:MAG: glycine/sarcosine/betaine reductase selenoprotein B family protein [Desulfuromonadaceae bacterium]|nr:glycine/sarcosine/betaine reductase selenoprotein B family protein [Desulfuromonadaceae bacterium]